MNATCPTVTPDALQQALTVAGNLWLGKEWVSWLLAGVAAQGLRSADTVSNLAALINAFNAVEKQLAESENDHDIKTHLPAFLEKCQADLRQVEEALLRLQVLCAQRSRLAHFTRPVSALALGIREQRGALVKIESELKSSSAWARHLARSGAGPLTPEEQIAQVQSLQSSTWPSMPSLQPRDLLSGALGLLPSWRQRISKITDLEQGVGMTDSAATVPVARVVHGIRVELSTLRGRTGANAGLDASAQSACVHDHIMRCTSPLSMSDGGVPSDDTLRSRALHADVLARMKRLEGRFEDMTRATV